MEDKAFRTLIELLKHLERRKWHYAIRKSEYAWEYTKTEREQAKAVYDFIDEIEKFIFDNYLGDDKE